MTKLEEYAMRDILTWAIVTQAHGMYDNFKEMIKGYWSATLNTNADIDSMWCDGDSSPLTDLDYSSPQPGVTAWDLN